LTKGEVIPNKIMAKKVVRYVLIGEGLFKRGFTTPLLKCVCKEQAEYVLNELHNGVCKMHCGHRTLAARVIRAGYYCPTARQDCAV